MANEELIFFKTRGNRHKPFKEFDNGIFVWLHFLILMTPHANAGEDQKCTKDIDDPMEFLEQGCTDGDQCTAHNQCTKNSPEKHTVLISSWYCKEREDQDENKDVIDTESFLDQIAC